MALLPKDQVHLKIMADAEGFKVIENMPDCNILATAAMSWEQALLASKFPNVKYVAFYWGGMTDGGIDAPKQILYAKKALEKSGVKIMVAGFRNYAELELAVQAAPDALSIPPRLLKQLLESLENPQSQKYRNRFEDAYSKINIKDV